MSPTFTPTTPVAASPVSPLGVQGFRERVESAPEAPAAQDSAAAPRLPFFEKFKNSLPNVDTATAAKSTAAAEPPSPTDSDSDYGGLAYADSDDGDEDIPLRASPQPIPPPAKAAEHSTSSSTSSSTAVPSSSSTSEGKVRFPSMTNTESRYSSSSSSTIDSPQAMMKRSLSASTARTVSKSTGAIERAMETLLEDDSPLSPTASTSSRPFTETQRESVAKSPKLPTRSHTSPTLPSGRLEQRRSGASTKSRAPPRARVCVRCEKRIDDGRWIQMEGGSVLCDKCWKNMYLPKVRHSLPPVLVLICVGPERRELRQLRQSVLLRRATCARLLGARFA